MVVLWMPVIRDADRMEFPSTRAAITASFFSCLTRFIVGAPSRPLGRYYIQQRDELNATIRALQRHV
jgi:hypothetical protein